VEKEIRSAETASTNVVGDDFPQRLQEELHRISVHLSPNSLGGCVNEVQIAKFRADSLIAGAFLSSGACIISKITRRRLFRVRRSVTARVHVAMGVQVTHFLLRRRT